MVEVERKKDQKAVKELYEKLKASGVPPEQYDEVVKKVGKK